MKWINSKYDTDCSKEFCSAYRAEFRVFLTGKKCPNPPEFPCVTSSLASLQQIWGFRINLQHVYIHSPGYQTWVTVCPRETWWHLSQLSELSEHAPETCAEEYSHALITHSQNTVHLWHKNPASCCLPTLHFIGVFISVCSWACTNKMLPKTHAFKYICLYSVICTFSFIFAMTYNICKCQS